VFPIEPPELKQRLIREVLATVMSDNAKARELLPDGSYRRLEPAAGQERVRSQEKFLELAAQSAARRMPEVQPAPVPYTDSRVGPTRRPRKRQTH
jgi:polyphosphate kinase